MTTRTFNQEKEKLFNEINQNFESSLTKTTIYCKAKHNYFKFVKPRNQSNETIKKFLVNHAYCKQSTRIDVEMLSIMNNVNLLFPKGIDSIQEYKKTPTIFATFHNGSYRMLNNILVYNHFNVVLIVDTQVYNEQLETFMENYQRIIDTYHPNSDFVVLNADKKETFFQLKQYINKGYVLVVYLDGNSGEGSKNIKENANLLPITFFDKTLYVRKGIGVLAKLLNAQIVTSIAHTDNLAQDNEQINIQFYESITVETKEDVDKAVQHCYSLLANNYLNKQPEQWECWYYIEKWVDIDTYSSPLNLIPDNNYIEENKGKFNYYSYSLLEDSTGYLLYDGSTFSGYEIDKETYDLFNTNDIIDTSTFSPDILQELLERKVLL